MKDIDEIEKITYDIFYKFSNNEHKSSPYYYRSFVRNNAYINEYDRDKGNIRYVISGSDSNDPRVLIVLNDNECIIRRNNILIHSDNPSEIITMNTKDEYFNANVLYDISVSFDFLCKIKSHLETLSNNMSYVIFMPDIIHELCK